MLQVCPACGRRLEAARVELASATEVPEIVLQHLAGSVAELLLAFSKSLKNQELVTRYQHIWDTTLLRNQKHK
jgi:hypothetical protein